MSHTHTHRESQAHLPPRLKPSGVEWLGDIPDHWEVRKLKWCVRRSEIKAEADDVETMRYIGLERVSSWTGRLSRLDDQQAPEPPESLSNSFAEGEVLFSKLRPYLAKAFCAEFDGVCSTEFLTLEPLDFEPRYLLHLLLTGGFVALVDSSTYGAKMPRANWEFIGNLSVPVPPLTEQRAIAQFLDEQTERIDELSAKVETAIERLQEYRTALVTAAVTGKIDVRDSATIKAASVRT